MAAKKKRPPLQTPKGWTGRYGAGGVRTYTMPSKTVCVRDFGKGGAARYLVLVKVSGRWVEAAERPNLAAAVTHARKEAAALKGRSESCRLVIVKKHYRKCPTKKTGHKGHKSTSGGHKGHKTKPKVTKKTGHKGHKSTSGGHKGHKGRQGKLI